MVRLEMVVHMSTRRLAITLAGLLLVTAPAARGDDILDEARKRRKVEAERVEKEFADERAAAYRLVRSDNPKLSDATDKLYALLDTVRSDTALESSRRAVLIVTVKADLDRVAQIAAERRRFSARRDSDVARTIRRDEARTDASRRADPSRRVSDEAKSIYESRSRAVADARGDRLRNGDRFRGVMSSVDESAVPESRDYKLPKNWAELSQKRTAGVKMTAKEKAIMKALAAPISVEYDKNSFQEVLDHLRKATGLDIVADKRAMDEMGVTYDSQITLKLRTSTRTVLKRVLSELNLAYVIKDEAIQITSRERAAQMTTTRAYYVGDLASVVDLRFGPLLNQLQMIENVNRLITMIKQEVDPRSWRDNNPDAPGTIVFDPITMSIVVKQTAEVHFLMGGFR